MLKNVLAPIFFLIFWHLVPEHAPNRSNLTLRYKLIHTFRCCKYSISNIVTFAHHNLPQKKRIANNINKENIIFQYFLYTIHFMNEFTKIAAPDAATLLPDHVLLWGVTGVFHRMPYFFQQLPHRTAFMVA